jgi:FdhD protein
MKNSAEADPIEKVLATRIDKDGRRPVEESVVKTGILTIYVNGSELVSLVCTPTDLKSLVAGFLVSEGFLTTRDELGEITIVRGKTCVADVITSSPVHRELSGRGMLVTSGCGGGAAVARVLEEMGKQGPLAACTFRAADIARHMREVGRQATLFSETGGAHTAGLFNQEELTFVMEDVGRHNALDKVIGAAFLDGVDVACAGLASSGRLSVDAVSKALVCRVPLLVSRSAPTSMAVELARRAGLTLVGFVRGSRMNVYCGEERIIVD